MSIDLDKLNSIYREAYTFYKKGKSKPIAHIDNFSTYYYGKIEESQLKEIYDLFESTPNEDILKFIHDNLPSNTTRIIAKLGDRYEIIMATLLDDRQMVIYNSATKGNLYSDEDKVQLSKVGYTVLISLALRLSEENTYLGLQTLTCKNKRTGKDYPLEITYVSKEKKPQYISPISDNRIDWKHSWLVCGHWRSINGIGKNRYEERIVLGKTWINPSIKGSGRYINKTRVIGESK